MNVPPFFQRDNHRDATAQASALDILHVLPIHVLPKALKVLNCQLEDGYAARRESVIAG